MQVIFFDTTEFEKHVARKVCHSKRRILEKRLWYRHRDWPSDKYVQCVQRESNRAIRRANRETAWAAVHPIEEIEDVQYTKKKETPRVYFSWWKYHD